MSLMGSACLVSPISAEPLHKLLKALTRDESALATRSGGFKKPLLDPVPNRLRCCAADRGGCCNLDPLGFSIIHGFHLIFPFMLCVLTSCLMVKCFSFCSCFLLSAWECIK